MDSREETSGSRRDAWIFIGQQVGRYDRLRSFDRSAEDPRVRWHAQCQIRGGRCTVRPESPFDSSKRLCIDVAIKRLANGHDIETRALRRQPRANQVERLRELWKIGEQDSPAKNRRSRFTCLENVGKFAIANTSPQPGAHGRIHPCRNFAAEKSQERPRVRRTHRTPAIFSSRKIALAVYQPCSANLASGYPPLFEQRSNALLAHPHSISGFKHRQFFHRGKYCVIAMLSSSPRGIGNAITGNR